VPAPQAVVLHHVEHARHLREDQHARPALLEPREQLVQQHHLAAVLDEVVAGEERRARLGALEQVRVVAALAQLHDHVEQARAVRAPVDGGHVLLQERLVPLALHLGHADFQDGLFFGRQAALDVRLEAAQQEGAQDLVQLAHDLGLARALGLGVLGGGGGRGRAAAPRRRAAAARAARRAAAAGRRARHRRRLLGARGAKPLLKLLRRREHLRQQEVEQRPQLVQVVLKGRARDQEAVVRAHQPHHLAQHAVLVLDAVRLVDDDVPPVEAAEEGLLLDHHLVGGDHAVEGRGGAGLGARRGQPRLGRLALLGVAVEADRVDDGAEALDLVHPVAQGGFGHDDQVRAADLAELAEVGQQRDGLQRLAEALLLFVFLGGVVGVLFVVVGWGCFLSSSFFSSFGGGV